MLTEDIFVLNSPCFFLSGLAAPHEAEKGVVKGQVELPKKALADIGLQTLMKKPLL